MHWWSNLQWDAWSAIFTGIGVIAGLVFGVPTAWIGLRSLRVMSQTRELESVTRFLEYLDETTDNRRAIMHDIDLSGGCTTFTKEQEQILQSVVNLLNRIGFMMDARLLSPKLLFGMCHTMIIRCCYILEPYVKYHEEKIGGRYGRRLEKLARQAQFYHDAKPDHRVTKIKISPSNKVVYETRVPVGFPGLMRRVSWLYARTFNKYW